MTKRLISIAICFALIFTGVGACLMLMVTGTQAQAATSDEIAAEIEVDKGKLAGVESDASDTSDEIDECVENIETVSAEIHDTALAMEEYRDGMGERIRYFYENGESGILEAILSSGSIAKMLNAVEMQTALYEYDTDCLNSYREYAEELSAKEAELAACEDELSALLAEKEKEIEELNKDISEKESQYESAKAKEEAEAKAAEEQRKAEEAAEAARRAQENSIATTATDDTGYTVSDGDTKSGYTGYENVSVSDAQMDVASKVYSVLKALGWTNGQIAGALGNIETESVFDPTSVETIYNEPFMIGSRKQSFIDADFIMSVCYPGYKFSKVYRAGIGLIGWTDTTDGATGNSSLRAYAAAHGSDWYTLDIQIKYLIDPSGDSSRAEMIRNYHNYNKYGTDNAYSGAYWWANYIEGCTYDMDKRLSRSYAWENAIEAGTVYYNEEYANSLLGEVG